MQSTFALLTLLLIVALGLVSPAGCAGCRLDTHGGQALHVVFEHPHPDAPAEGDDLSVRLSGQAEVHASTPFHSVGQLSLTGQVSPSIGTSSLVRDPDGLLVATAHSPPTAPSLSPLDPPPRMA